MDAQQRESSFGFCCRHMTDLSGTPSPLVEHSKALFIHENKNNKEYIT